MGCAGLGEAEGTAGLGACAGQEGPWPRSAGVRVGSLGVSVELHADCVGSLGRSPVCSMASESTLYFLIILCPTRWVAVEDNLKPGGGTAFYPPDRQQFGQQSNSPLVRLRKRIPAK